MGIKRIGSFEQCERLLAEELHQLRVNPQDYDIPAAAHHLYGWSSNREGYRLLYDGEVFWQVLEPHHKDWRKPDHFVATGPTVRPIATSASLDRCQSAALCELPVRPVEGDFRWEHLLEGGTRWVLMRRAADSGTWTQSPYSVWPTPEAQADPMTPEPAPAAMSLALVALHPRKRSPYLALTPPRWTGHESFRVTRATAREIAKELASSRRGITARWDGDLLALSWDDTVRTAPGQLTVAPDENGWYLLGAGLWLWSNWGDGRARPGADDSAYEQGVEHASSDVHAPDLTHMPATLANAYQRGRADYLSLSPGTAHP